MRSAIAPLIGGSKAGRVAGSGTLASSSTALTMASKRAGLVCAPEDGADQHQLRRVQLLQAVQDQRRRTGDVLDHHARRPLKLLQVADQLVTEVEVALGGATEAPDEDAAPPVSSGTHHSSVQPQELTSRTITPRPVSMCVVHGMHGSKLRTARRTSMPLTCSSGTLSRIGVSTIASS